MSDQAKPNGPDLTKGVPAAYVAEGGMLAGQVGEEAVLVARVDGMLHAVSAFCTHYQAPLADGLIKDGVVRCPWHHACFSLKTGEAVGAPAIDPLACYTVEEADGRIIVKGKKAAAPGKKMAAPDAIKRVVIVGGGAAGFAAAEMLRRKGYTGELTLLSADADAPYDRPNCSKDYLAGEAEEAWMPLREPGFYEENKIDLRLNTEVESFDPKARTVALPGGKTLAYDALILATGAEPQRPPIPGLDGPNVHLMRSLKDAQALIAAAKTAKTVAVIGASFIGLEVAAALKARKLAVHVVAPEDVPFEKILGREIGEWVLGEHKKNGVVFHLGRKVTAYKDKALTLDQGRFGAGRPRGAGRRGQAAHRAGQSSGTEGRQGDRGGRSPPRRGGRLCGGRHRPLSRSRLRRPDPGGALGARRAPGPARGAADYGRGCALH